MSIVNTLSRKYIPAVLLAGILLGGAGASGQNDQPMVISRTADQSEIIPINLSGFSGEVLSALKFDLEAVGFQVKSAEASKYQVTGANDSHVEGRLTVSASKAELLAKAYQGGSMRTQAHALADDIIAAIRHCKGIAQTRIAYKGVTGETSEIYIADYDGNKPVAVTSDHTIVAAPAWAPGGRMLYYTSYKLGNPDVYSHDLSSGARKIVARYTGLNTSAAISPDGQHIAMILSKAGSPDLYVGNADGTGLKQLTTTKEDESSPCWSPDGKTICFTSRMNGRPQLFTIPAGGGAMKRLQTQGVLNTTEADWSPDGQFIAFTANMGSFQICVLELKTGTVKTLTAGEDPSWGPNSRTLLFNRRVGGKNIVSLLDVPTKQVKDIAQISANCSQACWAR
jgi:TolB protein